MYRRIALALIAAAAVWLAVTRGPEVLAVAETAAGASWAWLGVAAFLQVGYYAGYVLTFREAFSAAGLRRGFRELLPVVLASIFVNTVTPAAGTAGPALLVDDAARRGHPAARAAAAVVAAQFADFAGFGVVMVVGMGYLLASGRLRTYEVVSAAAFLVLLAAFAAALLVAGRKPDVLRAVLARVEAVVARFFRRLREEPHAGWSRRAADGFSTGARTIAENPSRLLRAWLAAVVGHSADLACFIAVGYAFGWRGVGSLVAAYAVGIVVWLVSIVPQGVGIVEGALALVLVSFGAPPATAAAISLVFRGMTFWLPFALGAVSLRRTASFGTTAVAGRAFAVRASAVAVALVGVMDIVSAITPSLAGRLHLLERYLPFQVQYGHLSATLAGLALLVVARGLWHRKRAAWVLTELLLVSSAASHMLKGLDYEEAIIAVTVAVWLLIERRQFYARSDAPSILQGLRVLAMALVATLVYGTVGFYLLDRHFSVDFGAGAAIRQTVVMFTQFYDPGLQPVTGFGRYFAYSIYVVGAASVGYALLMLLRSVLVRHPATAAQHTRAASIVAAYGRSDLAPILLLPDKSYWFSDGGSVVGYTAVGRIALALGDPVGPAADLAETIRGVREFAARNGWDVAFYQTREETIGAYADAGLSAVRIGHEAIVDVRSFSLSGKSRKNLRNRANRLEEEGYRAVVHEPPLSGRLLREMREVSDAWLELVNGSEKRFSLGWFDEAYLRERPVMAVHAPGGGMVAFANILTEYQLAEVTVDLMRHLLEAPAGVMDFLFLKLFAWTSETGRDTFNLGLSPLAGIGEEDTDPAAEKALRLVYEHANNFYGFKGLYRFKDKFDPRWDAKYLVYPDAATLPAVLAALVSANSGGGTLARLLRRHHEIPA